MKKLIRFIASVAVGLIVTWMFLKFTHTPRQAICGLIGMMTYFCLDWEGE